MAKHVTGKLSARAIERANLAPGRYSDGGGLYLVVDASRSRWVFRYTVRKKTTDIGVGPRRDVSLAQARKKASDYRNMIAAGLDPKAEKLRSYGSNTTFGPFALEMWEEWKKEYRNAKHIWQWRHTVETHCRLIWDRPIDKVTRDDVLAILKPVWDATVAGMAPSSR